MDRREFLQLLIIGYTYGFLKPSLAQDNIDYQISPFGNLRLLHITDTHSQLQPVYFREPNVNIGVGVNRNQPPHIVGDSFLEHYSVDSELLKYVRSGKIFSLSMLVAVLLSDLLKKSFEFKSAFFPIHLQN